MNTRLIDIPESLTHLPQLESLDYKGTPLSPRSLSILETIFSDSDLKN